jgi:hypothetical protein
VRDAWLVDGGRAGVVPFDDAHGDDSDDNDAGMS